MTTRATPPTENELIVHAVQELARRTGFPVTFGGLLQGGEVHITAVHGARTRNLEGLRVRPDHGLGGRAMVELRPRMTSDYGTASRITHDYDDAVLGEGISTLLAVPVIVGGVTRGLLYAGGWGTEPLGEVEAGPAFQVAEALAAELRTRDEVRLRAHRPEREIAPTTPVAELPVPVREELRDVYAQLRVIAGRTDARADHDALEALAVRITALIASPALPATDVHLSPREIDVLACAALGATNADIARQLGLQPGTVKAYLATAMSKLGVSSRIAAVSEARRIGLLG